MTKTRLDALLARYEPRLAARFRSLMARVRSRRTVAELEVLIESGAGAEVVSQILDDVDAAAKVMAAEAAAIDAAAGKAITAWIAGQVGASIVYDTTNLRAVARLATSRRYLSLWWGQDQREAIEAVLSEVGRGLVTGVNPRQMAIAIRDSIGLTPDRARAVTAYRRALETGSRRALGYELRDKRSDRTVAAASKVGGKPLPQAKIDKMVKRYHDRQIASRAETIARTEANRALHGADDEAFAQVIEGGKLEVDRIQEEWLAGSPPRTRGHHVSMDGQLRRYQETFRSGLGNQLKYPCDPDAPAIETVNCRCKRIRKILPRGQVAVSSDDGGEGSETG